MSDNLALQRTGPASGVLVSSKSVGAMPAIERRSVRRRRVWIMPDESAARSLREVKSAHRVVMIQEWYLRVRDDYIKYVETADRQQVKAEMDAMLSQFREKLDALSEFQRGVVYGKMYALSWVLGEPDTDLEEVAEFIEPPSCEG